MNIEIWGWDYAVAPFIPQWQKVHLDRVTGNLQVDVVTSGLPAGGATAAHQVTQITSLQLIDDLRNALGSVNTDDLQVDIKDIADGEIKCYGWDTANWQRLTLEGVGLHNLRVKQYDGLNPIDSQLVDFGMTTERGLAVCASIYGYNMNDSVLNVWARNNEGDAALNTMTGLLTLGRLYGYNGTTWDRLRMESDALHNLRVKLYDGANGIQAMTGNGYAGVANYRLLTTAIVYGYDATDFRPVYALITDFDNADTDEASLLTFSHLYGFNGAKWDRLRTYGVGILKVGRAGVGLLDVRMVAVGQVGAVGARRLYWMLLNPSAGNSVVELTDAAAGGAAVKADHFDTTRDGHMITFDPPLEFSTGIYLETFTNMTSITFGYL